MKKVTMIDKPLNTHLVEPHPMFELTAAPSWLSQLHHEARRVLYQQLNYVDQHLTIVMYQPDKDCFIRADDPVKWAQQCPDLISLHMEQRSVIGNDDATLDPMMCQIVFHLCTTAEPNQVITYFAKAEQAITLYRLNRQFLAFPEGEFTPTDAYKLFIDDVNFSVVNQLWDKYTYQVRAMNAVTATAPYQQSIIQWLVSLSHEAKPNIRIIKALLEACDNGQFSLEDDIQRAKIDALASFTPLSQALQQLPKQSNP
mgnify:CR=1 FL=1